MADITREKCRARVKAASPEGIDESIVDDIIDNALRLKKLSGGDKAKFSKMVIEDANNVLLRSERARSSLIEEMRLYKSLRKVVDQDAFKNDPSIGIRSLMNHVNKLHEGSKDNVSSIAAMSKNRSATALEMKLKEGGLFEIFTKNLLEKEIRIEKYNLDGGGKSSVSGSDQAFKIAKTLKSFLDMNLKEKQTVGLDVGMAKGYLGKRAWDRVNIRENKTDFIVSMEKALDPKLWENSSALEYLEGAYNDIITGKYDMSLNEAGTEGLLTLNNKGNINKFRSKSREFEFLSPELEAEMISKFGRNNLSESILGEIESHAKAISITKVFGLNPETTLDRLIKQTESKLKADGNDVGLKELQMGKADIKAYFNHLAGNNVGDTTNLIHSLTRGTLMVQSMSKLGLAWIDQPIELMNNAIAVNAMTGRGVLKSVDDIIGGFKNYKTAKEFAVVTESALGEMYNDIGNGNGGSLDKLNTFYWKVNPLGHITKRQAGSNTFVLSNKLSEHVRGVSDVDANIFEANIGRFGINKKDFPILQRMVMEHDGLSIIDPSAVDAIPLDIISQHLSEQGIAQGAKQYQMSLKNAVSSLFHDNALLATNTPNEYLRYRMGMNTSPGTLAWSVNRLFMQFKNYPMAELRLLDRVRSSNPNKPGGDYKALVQMVMMTTVMGYLAVSARELVKGKTPLSMTDPETWKKAFLRSGSGTLLADIALSDYTKYGAQGPVDIVAGPTYSVIKDSLKLGQKAAIGKPEWGKMAELGMKQTPFYNYLGAKQARDYLFMNGVMEWLDPKFMENKREYERKQLEGSGQ